MSLINESDLRNAAFTWENEFNEDRYGVCFPSLRVVAINPFIDYSIVSQRTFDEIVYHEILHLRQENLGIKLADPHDEQFDEWERRYPYYEVAKKELLSLSLDFDEICGMKNPPKDLKPEWIFISEDELNGRVVEVDSEPSDEMRLFFPTSMREEGIVRLTFGNTGDVYYRIQKLYEFHTGRTGFSVTLDPTLVNAPPNIIRAIRKDIDMSLRTSLGAQDRAVLEFIGKESKTVQQRQSKIVNLDRWLEDPFRGVADGS